MLFYKVTRKNTAVIEAPENLESSTETDVPKLANVELHPLFSDHMIIQQNKNIKVWGQAPKGEAIVVEFNGQKKVGVVGPNGTFLIELDPMKAGGPYQLKVNNKIIDDIYLGEVWLAGGQSNMEWALKNCESYEEELKSEDFANIRMVKIPKVISNKPQDWTEELEWKISNIESIGSFSGLAYHFSKELNKELNVPIGIIDNSWGGTDIEGWMSLSSLEAFPKLYEKGLAFKSQDFDLEKEQEKIEKWSEGLELADKGMQEKWYNDRMWDEWEKIEVPGKWENQGFKNLDGIVWLARSFRLSELPDQNSTVQINLAAIDDSDITFLNGVEIGRTSGWDVERTYSIDARMLRKENYIHVRVRDDGYGGGIHGEKEKVFISINGKKESLAGEWKLKNGTEGYEKKPEGMSVNGTPTNRFNSMVYPLRNFPLSGVIWYQGETNASTKESAENYGNYFKSMIDSYRSIWSDSLSFCFVQLANFMPVTSPSYSHWGEVRKGQDSALELYKTAMATAIDLGEADDIHPRDKKSVAKRLASAALAIEYDKDVDYKNLRYHSHKVEGSRIKIQLKNQGTGLVSKGNLTAFHVLDKNGNYHTVSASLKGDEIIVETGNLDWQILYYAWMSNPGVISLYNSYGLPLVPFKIIK